MTNKKAISEFELLLIANQVIQDHADYVEGMRATSVTEKDDVLIFKGEFFLDEQGLPTEKPRLCLICLNTLRCIFQKNLR